MKNFCRHKVMQCASFVFVLTIVAIFLGCAFAPEPTQNGYSSGSIDDLELRSIFRQPYMGGSVVYDPDHAENSQLVPGAAIAVRLGYVQYEGDAINGNYKDDTSRPADYGYIKVLNIDSGAIELAYTCYSSIGSRITTDHKLKKGEKLDLNYDGIPDVVYAPPPLKRAAMPNVVYLTFLSEKYSQNTSLFSVIPTQYAAGEHPNGLLGVNPEGKFVFTMLRQKSYEMVDITDAVATIDDAEKHKVMGMQAGDYVLVPNSYSYTTDTAGETTITSTVGGYKRVATSAKGLYQTRKTISEAHLEDIPISTSVDFTAHDFEDLQAGAAKSLYTAIPTVSSKPIAIADTDAAYIAALNTLLGSSTAISEIRTANPALVFDGETEAQLTEIVAGLATASTTEDADTVHEVKAANRFFLTLAFPEYCPPSSIVNGQNLAEVHPLFSFNYSAEDNLNGISASGGAALYRCESFLRCKVQRICNKADIHRRYV